MSNRPIYAKAQDGKLILFAPLEDGGTEYFEPIEGAAFANLLAEIALVLASVKLAEIERDRESR